MTEHMTTEQKMGKLIERERAKFAEYDQTMKELAADLARVRETGREITGLMAQLDDLSLRINAIESRVAMDREQREKWFEVHNNLVTDVLKNRKMIRELYDMAEAKTPAGGT